MRIENRELFATFWDAELEAGVYALLIGWVGDDPSTLRPVVAYDFGVRTLTEAFTLYSKREDAVIEAHWLRGELRSDTRRSDSAHRPGAE